MEVLLRANVYFPPANIDFRFGIRVVSEPRLRELERFWKEGLYLRVLDDNGEERKIRTLMQREKIVTLPPSMIVRYLSVHEAEIRVDRIGAYYLREMRIYQVRIGEEILDVPETEFPFDPPARD